MKSRRVVIELLGSRVDVVQYGARCERVAWRRVTIPPATADLRHATSLGTSPATVAGTSPATGRLSDDAASWVREVRQLGAVLKPVIAEMGLVGEEALVLYRSPTQAVDLAAFDPRVMRSRHEACEAAKLAVFDSVTYSALSAVCEAAVMGRDRAQPRNPRNLRNIESPRNIHVVVAADREDVANAIVYMVEEAGLRFACATPTDAAVAARLVKSSLDGRRAGTAPHRSIAGAVVDDAHPTSGDQDDPQGGARALLYIGEHSSLFLYADDGALCFSRRVNLGAATLAAALGRPVRIEGDAEPVQLPLETTRDVLYGLFGGGIADRTAVIYPPLGLHGYDLLPLIQPMLQRSIVEIRQSLRFGVQAPGAPGGEGHEISENIKLICTGPGSAIPGLPELIGTELQIAVERDARVQGYRHDEPGVEGSELADAAAEPWLCDELNLQPAQFAHDRRMKRLRRWMWTGAAAALAVIAFDTFRFSVRAHDARQTANALVSQAASDEALRLTAHRLITAMEHMHRMESLIDQETGARVDFRAVMHELSRITPDTIRYTNVSFRRNRNEIEGTLSGFAAQSSAESQATDLRLLVDALRGSPLFNSVVLGNVQHTTMAETPGERFEASVIALPAPAPRLAEAPPKKPPPALSSATEQGGAP